jgi:hypothetical protein
MISYLNVGVDGGIHLNAPSPLSKNQSANAISLCSRAHADVEALPFHRHDPRPPHNPRPSGTDTAVWRAGERLVLYGKVYGEHLFAWFIEQNSYVVSVIARHHALAPYFL